MAGAGHEERFPLIRLSAGYGFGKETIARVRHNGRDAPIPDLHVLAMKREVRPLSSHRRLRRCRGSVRVTPREAQRPGRWCRPDHSGLDQYAERPGDNLIPKLILTLRRLTVGRCRDDEIVLRPVGKNAAKAERGAFVIPEPARVRPVSLRPPRRRGRKPPPRLTSLSDLIRLHSMRGHCAAAGPGHRHEGAGTGG